MPIKNVQNNEVKKLNKWMAFYQNKLQYNDDRKH